MENENDLNELLRRVEALSKKQDQVQHELNHLKVTIKRIQKTSDSPIAVPEAGISEEEKTVPVTRPVAKTTLPPPPKKPTIFDEWLAKAPSRKDFEKFIGGNLLLIIGILILVFGVAIGGKFAINNGMISPLTRIVLGYLMGLGLIGFAIRLKQNYEVFSATLLSGGMSILYFMTFFAYSFYELIPQTMAFGLMVLFTVFTVVAALNYDRQIIAHLGLVGSYAVPFLLSNDSGNVVVLFSYMAIINIGILVIGFRKYWKPLFYVAFVMTWLIYSTWQDYNYSPDVDFGIAFLFLSVFFFIFYATFLAYKLIRKEQFEKSDILLVITNAFVFYGLGYVLLSGQPQGKEILGLFTLANALIHFVVSAIIYRWKLADRNLFYLISGLVLVFLTIAVPVQLDGNWVTLIWIGEAALLFWIARTRQVSFYETLSYASMLLAFFSLIDDWGNFSSSIHGYDSLNVRFQPILNIEFLTGTLFVLAFGFINWLYFNKKYDEPHSINKGLYRIMSFAIPSMFLISLFNLFFYEISGYWLQAYSDSILKTVNENDYERNLYNRDLLDFKTIWQLNYAMFFFSLLAWVNMKWLKVKPLAWINIGLIVFVFLGFLSIGQESLSDLRASYLSQNGVENYDRSVYHILIRYVSLVFASGLLYVLYRYVRSGYIKDRFRLVFEIFFHFSILALLSFELIGWMDMGESTQPHRLGLSILWGLYALFLIGIGIRQNKKTIRLIAMGLLGLTLAKVFFYDLAHMDTIGKTVVLVTLGILLLIISFLYKKFTDNINDEPTNIDRASNKSISDESNIED